MKKKCVYKVVWDNGASASGTFPYEFSSRKEADDYGKDWADESNLRDFGEVDPYEGYSYEVMCEEPLVASKPRASNIRLRFIGGRQALRGKPRTSR